MIKNDWSLRPIKIPRQDSNTRLLTFFDHITRFSLSQELVLVATHAGIPTTDHDLSLRSKSEMWLDIFTKIEETWLVTWTFMLTVNSGWPPGVTKEPTQKTTRSWWESSQYWLPRGERSEEFWRISHRGNGRGDQRSVNRNVKSWLLIDCQWGGSLEYYRALWGDQVNVIERKPKSSAPARRCITNGR